MTSKTGCKGFSTLEYLMLLVCLLGSFVIMWKYLQSALQGHYRKAGSTLSQLREYDPVRTRDCIWNPKQRIWYSDKCFDFESSSAPVAGDSPQLVRYCSDSVTTSILTTCLDANFKNTCPKTCRYAEWRFKCKDPCQSAVIP